MALAHQSLQVCTPSVERQLMTVRRAAGTCWTARASGIVATAREKWWYPVRTIILKRRGTPYRDSLGA